MTTVGMPRGHVRPHAQRMRPATILRDVLLTCGIVSSLLYVAMNVFVAMQSPGYSSASQTVSELSAIGAPTRQLWMWLAIPYTLLVTAFGWGVWRSAGENRALRTAGALLLVYGALGVVWPFAPMHLRPALAAGGGTLSDTTHIALGIVTVVLMLLAIGAGAVAFGTRFRRYSLATLVIVFVFGFLTAVDAPAIPADRPTPWIGVWERINIGAFLLWVIALAVALLRAPPVAATTRR